MPKSVPTKLERYCHLCEATVIFTHAGSKDKEERYQCPNMLVEGERHSVLLSMKQVVASEPPKPVQDSPETFFTRRTEKIQRQAREAAEKQTVERSGTSWMVRFGRRTLELVGLGDVAAKLFSSPSTPVEKESLPEKPDLSKDMAEIEDIEREIGTLPDPDDIEGDELDDLLDQFM